MHTTPASTMLLATVAALLAVACTSIARPSAELDETLAPNLLALEDRGVFPFQGEQMSYTVEHTGLKAKLLELTVNVGYEGTADDGTAYIPITGFARSISIARMLARVDDTAETYIDPRTWRPHYAVKDLDENGNQRAYRVWFWPEELYATVEKYQGNTLNTKNIPLPASALDAVSWIYHLRAVDLDANAQQTWIVYDGWVISRLTIVVGPREEVWTPIGFFDARRIDIYREKVESHWPHGALAGAYADPELSVTGERYFFGNVWISDDANRIPVRLAVETKVGDLDLRIEGYQPPAPLASLAARQ